MNWPFPQASIINAKIARSSITISILAVANGISVTKHGQITLVRSITKKKPNRLVKNTAIRYKTQENVKMERNKENSLIQEASDAAAQEVAKDIVNLYEKGDGGVQYMLAWIQAYDSQTCFGQTNAVLYR